MLKFGRVIPKVFRGGFVCGHKDGGTISNKSPNIGHPESIGLEVLNGLFVNAFGV